MIDRRLYGHEDSIGDRNLHIISITRRKIDVDSSSATSTLPDLDPDAVGLALHFENEVATEAVG